MKKLMIVCCALGLCGCNLLADHTPVAWEHGYKTSEVTATRIKNPALGYLIRFELPNHPDDCDSADMDQWLTEHDVHAIEMGGYPGAPILAVVKGVTDRESANKKLVEFLPEFSRWVNRNLH